MTEEWRRVADKVRNWGRWGEDDQLGTLNHITPEIRVSAAGLARTGKAISLAIPLDGDSPMGARGIRRPPLHLMSVDGGDQDIAKRLAGWGTAGEREVEYMSGGDFQFNDDWIFMALQSSTQWDALCHAYYDGQLYNGVPASASTSFGVTRNAIDAVAAGAGVAGRGVLLDVAGHRGVSSIGAGAVIPPAELDEVARSQGVTIQKGDIVIVRTGWWSEYAAMGPDNAVAWQGGSPGVSWRTAEWLSDHEVAAIACDNLCVEPVVPEDGVLLPLHMIALRDMGLMLGEIWDLEALAADCAADGVYEFLLVAPPLRVTGGTGSPVNPIAFK